MRSTLPAILVSFGIALLAGCASGPVPSAANDRSLQPSAAPRPERGTVTARMNGQFGWYGGVASGGR